MSSLVETLTGMIASGPMLAAIAVAALAGLLSFASPCVLPLLPGYVGYLGGLAGTAPTTTGQRAGTARAVAAGPDSLRVLWGMTLFVLGFTAVFVLLGVVFAAAGARFHGYVDVVMRLMGVVIILMGVAFLGHLPFLQRDTRIRMSPRFGLWGAPLLGATFGLGWSPCIGPTLAAVLALSFGGADPARGAILTLAYCLGLGIPFILLGVGFSRSTRTLSFLRRHRRAISRFGGAVLIVVGLLLVTGLWGGVTAVLQGWVAGFTTVL